ncbi:MAG: preprotein translocase subunit SecE [Chloroflexi bacterium]|nr:preprotein translocase subunit SecE [Chloroflexota bacterium]
MRQTSVKTPGKQRFKFFGEVITELKKVTWLSRREATYLTTLVIVFTVVVAIILGVIDYGFSRLMEVILIK